jgi:hypothetical protein
MLAGLRFTLLISFVALVGCGATPYRTVSQPNLSGNWYVSAGANTHGVYASPVYSFIGALQVSGSSVTGTVRATDLADTVPCISPEANLTATGNFDTASNLSLTVPVAGGTAAIVATIGNPNGINNGTWQIVGGSCAMPKTPVVIAEIAPITGTYAGAYDVIDLTTLQHVPGSAMTLTANIVQSATPNADGQFPITGTLTATGSCNGTFLLASEVVSGGQLLATYPATGVPTVALLGGVEPAATYLVVDFGPVAGCGSQTYSGTLIRQ